MKISKRQRRLAADNILKQTSEKFVEMDLSQREHPEWMTRAFRNNKYIVMIMDNAEVTTGTAIRALVQNNTDTPIVNHWSVMQKIKNEIFGPDKTAIEYYPAEKNLVDRHNIYWMWIFPEGVLPMPINP